MSIVVHDPGVLKEATAAQAAYNASNPVIRLFVNNFTPTRPAILADFIEAVTPGYVPQNANTWAAPVVTADRAIIVSAAVIFDPTGYAGGLVAYGYFALDFLTGDLLFSERFIGGPITLTAGGPSLVMPITRTVYSENP